MTHAAPIEADASKSVALSPAAPSEPVDSIALARAIIAQHSKSFSLASKLLPPEVRDDAVVLYAWCRRVDDAVDDAPVEQQPDALRALRAELDAVYVGRELSDPLLRAFAELVHRRGIPRLYADELLAGMEMDVRGTRYETLDQLLLYCYRVAATVGLMMCHVMGVRRDGALVHAAHLGIAMQLTNIARDVLEDFERGRVYLPAELLTRRGAQALRAEPGAPFPASTAPAVAATLGDVLDLADRYYRSGDAGLSDLAPRCALGVRVARLVYSRIGSVLRARGCDPLSGRAIVSTRRKLLLALRGVVATLASLPLAAFRPRPQAPRRALPPSEACPLLGGR